MLGIGRLSCNPAMSQKYSFPRKTLEQAIRVPEAIQRHNAGNPWPPDQIASALGVGPKGGNFFYVAAAARDYGLTEGGRDAAQIALTDLGRQAVAPQGPSDREESVRKAFLSVELFRNVLEYFKGNNLPEEPFRTNTLRDEFGIDPEIQAEFVDIFDKNCRFAGIGKDFAQERLSPRRSTTSELGDSMSVEIAAPESGDESHSCFVIMPFTEREDRHPTGFFDEVLESLLTPALTEAGFRVKTAKRAGTDVIQSTIVRELLEADLVVADLTEHNPNVLFELGVRMAEDLPVALIRASGTGPIFDVDNMLRVEDYNPNLWSSTISDDLPKLRRHFEASWENRETAVTFMKLLRPQPAAQEE